jgi:putative ABC transport system permease protein
MFNSEMKKRDDISGEGRSKQTVLPSFVEKFLRFICPAELVEEIEGDLVQKYERDSNRLGQSAADRNLVWNTVRFFRPGIILRNRISYDLYRIDALWIYLKVAFRHLLKSKAYSAINVIGLAVGLTAFFVITQYVSFEKSYDTFHENGHEIYRLALEFRENGELTNSSAKNYIEVGDVLLQYIPQVKHLTGFTKIPANTGFLFRYKDKLYNQSGAFIHGDSNFFKVFPSLLVRGDPNTALSEKHNLVISESMAKKIFGDIDPVGKRWENLNENENRGDYVISGVIRDIPANSHFHANFIGVVDRSEWGNLLPWQGFFYTYITMRDGDKSKLEAQLHRLNSWLERADPKTKGASVTLQQLHDIHLQSDLKDELEAGGSEKWLYILYSIGLVILIMAWINYINIQTARFITRAKEVGIRRIIGSRKADLAMQFLVEFAIITFLSTLIAGVLLRFIYTQFTFLTGIPISELRWSAPSLWLGSLSLVILGSLLAGVYPALYLLKLDPISSLKGKVVGSLKGRKIQKSLLIVQFTSSIVLISFLMVIDRQVEFMQMTNTKVELDKVISVRNPTAYMNEEQDEKKESFKIFSDHLTRNPAIQAVATSSAIPGAEIGFTYVDMIKRNSGDPFDPTRYKTLFIDYNFIPVYGLKLKAGRNYSDQNGEDENWETLILNESAVRKLGFTSAEEAIGQNVQFMAVEEWESYKIVGVVEDYHHEAIKKDIYPTIFFLNHNIGQQVYYSIRFNENAQTRDVVKYIEESWKEIFPEKQFEYFFLNDYYDQQFKAELHVGRVFALFSTIAIFIACLGILGMTLFETNARLREISIRKVLGASATSMIALLSKDNVRFIILSALVAVPVIYFTANEWLASYPSRIQLSFAYFILPVVFIFGLVVLTAGFQTINAVTSNPVDHLKHE